MTSPNTPPFWQTWVTTLIALLAFAANSVLCREALGMGAIDAGSFTAVRLGSGALVLLILQRFFGRGNSTGRRRSWLAPLMLFAYALGFSLAYRSLDTATGALILFGTVQLTMILVAQVRGERASMIEWLGVMVAFGGFVYLVLPNLNQPSAIGFGLMTLAGIAWGSYSLIGRGSQNPLADTAYNFGWTVPLIVLVVLFGWVHQHVSTRGLVLAVLSGGLASGVGYAIWYRALRGLSATQAAVSQLLVPVFAALGGVYWLGEVLTKRLIYAGICILGGIALVFLAKALHRMRKVTTNP